MAGLDWAALGIAGSPWAFVAALGDDPLQDLHPAGLASSGPPSASAAASAPSSSIPTSTPVTITRSRSRGRRSLFAWATPTSALQLLLLLLLLLLRSQVQHSTEERTQRVKGCARAAQTQANENRTSLQELEQFREISEFRVSRLSPKRSGSASRPCSTCSRPGSRHAQNSSSAGASCSTRSGPSATRRSRAGGMRTSFRALTTPSGRCASKSARGRPRALASTC